jgi:hypothetical protein
LAWTFLWRGIFCVFVVWSLHYAIGVISLLAGGVLLGGLYARPLIDLVAELSSATHERALEKFEGQYYVFRGHTFIVREDANHHRWLSFGDVRRVLPRLPQPRVLQRQYGERVEIPPIRPWRPKADDMIRADALLAYLKRSTDDESIRFRNWLEGDVCGPSARVRRNLGIRDD